MNASSVVFGMFLGFILTWIYMTIRHDLEQQANDRDRSAQERELREQERSDMHIDELHGKIDRLEERSKEGG